MSPTDEETPAMPTERPEMTHAYIRGIPPRLKGRIAKRVDQTESSFNDVVVAVLADYFEIPYTPTGGRSSGLTANPNPVLRMPVELKRRIDFEVAERRGSLRNVVVEILAREFGEPFVPTGRWVGRDRATA